MVLQRHYQQKRSTLIGLLSILVSTSIFSPIRCLAAEETNGFSKCWQELKADPQYSISQSLSLYHLKTANGSRAALVVLDLNDRSYFLKPFFNQKPKTVATVAKEQNALVGVNGGFFNLSNGESTSYVVIQGKEQCDPKTNKALINNPDLAPFLDTIFKRSELRILAAQDGKLKATIVPHTDPIPEGFTLVHSLQAGPSLLPQVTDTEEAFVRKTADGKVFDSINAHKNAARTAVGITRDNHILILSVADKKQDCFSAGVTLEDLSQMLRKLGCNRALNCDGGTSTSMVIVQSDARDSHDYVLHKEICREPEKLVKSGLLISKNVKRQNSRSPLNNFSR